MADQLSRVFAALADPTRRDLVARLTEADATVNDLAAPYDVSLQAVSKHLKVLEDAGLVTRSREAQRRPVHLEAEVFDLMTHGSSATGAQAEERYQRLDDVLAELDDDDAPTTATRRKEPHHDHRSHAATRYPEAAIVADATVPAIHIWRDFAATPEQLFRAHTDPDLFARWIGPRDRRPPRSTDWDARKNGSLALRRRSTARRVSTSFRGSFHTVRRRPDRADLHLGGHARRRRPGDRSPSRTSATAVPACTPCRCATPSRAATRGCAAAWRPA